MKWQKTFNITLLPISCSLLTTPFLVSCQEKLPVFDTPKINIIGDISTIGDEEIPMSIEYEDKEGNGFDADILIKVQGNGSTVYAKKNWNIKLFEKGTGIEKDVQLRETWEPDHKFTLKANYVDALSLHNTIGCKIWGDIVHQSQAVAELQSLLNGGAIDGFPVACYNNGKFWGLYTWNLKKHQDLFGMTKGDHQQAMILGDWSAEPVDYPHLYFKEPITSFDEGWDLEFCSTKNTDWALTSFNNFINSVIAANDETSFKAAINSHSNMLSLINYFIYISFIVAVDNTGNNLMWITYDGTHWIPSIYDLDYCYGHSFRLDESLLPPQFDFTPYTDKSLLFKKLDMYCHNEIIDEYNLLKASSLSYNNIVNRFEEGWVEVTEELWKADAKKWPEDVNRRIKLNTIANLKTWVNERIKYFVN